MSDLSFQEARMAGRPLSVFPDPILRAFLVWLPLVLRAGCLPAQPLILLVRYCFFGG